MGNKLLRVTQILRLKIPHCGINTVEDRVEQVETDHSVNCERRRLNSGCDGRSYIGNDDLVQVPFSYIENRMRKFEEIKFLSSIKRKIVLTYIILILKQKQKREVRLISTL